MRLIDADALIEHLREYKTVYGVPMTDSDKQVVHCIIGHIKNLEPTAYSVEAVVAELEEKKADPTGCYELSCDECKYAEYCVNGDLDYKVLIDKAISIIRGKEQGMKKTICICDHCGAEFNPMDGYEDTEISDFDFVKRVDLCMDCYNELCDIVREFVHVD